MTNVFLFKPAVMPNLNNFDEISKRVKERALSGGVFLEDIVADRLAYELLNPLETARSTSLTLPWIASYLNQNADCELNVYDQFSTINLHVNSFKQDLRKLENVLYKEFVDGLKQADIVGISMLTFDMPIIQKLFKQAKSEIGDFPFIVAGGPHPSALPFETLEELDFIDVVISGAGEVPLSMLVQGRPINQIPNITYRKDDGIKQTKTKCFSPNPSMKMDTHFIQPTGINLYKPELKFLSEITSFGCRNNCAYCSTPKYGDVGFVMRDLNVVLEEIEELSEWGKDICISFKDDNHFTSVKYIETLIKELKEMGLNNSKNAMMDPSLINQKRIELCKEGNYNLFVGRDYVTNASAMKYGRRLMGRSRDVEMEKSKIANLIDSGINTELSYIVPGPYDDMDYIRAVISDMIDLYAPNVQINAAELVPYPNTEIRTQLIGDCKIPKGNLNNWEKYTRALGNVVAELEPSVENWWINYDRIHNHLVQMTYQSNQPLPYSQIKLMAMSAALKDVELMEKLKAKITVPKQTKARG